MKSEQETVASHIEATHDKYALDEVSSPHRPSHYALHLRHILISSIWVHIQLKANMHTQISAFQLPAGWRQSTNRYAAVCQARLRRVALVTALIGPLCTLN